MSEQGISVGGEVMNCVWTSPFHLGEPPQITLITLALTVKNQSFFSTYGNVAVCVLSVAADSDSRFSTTAQTQLWAKYQSVR